MKKPAQSEPIVIKKYANRRLYNTDTSSYVTLDDLGEMVKEGAEFIVYDAKSGEDLTRQILTQIIFEEESTSGTNLLPISFLRNLITFYDNQMKDFLPAYLETSMQAFLKNQEQMRQYMLGGKVANPMDAFNQVAHQFEEISKQNMDMFTKAFAMFTPFGADEKKK